MKDDFLTTNAPKSNFISLFLSTLHRYFTKSFTSVGLG